MTEQRSWFNRVTSFLAYMRGKGHRYTWILRAQIAQPLGPGRFPADHDNDNRPRHT